MSFLCWGVVVFSLKSKVHLSSTNLFVAINLAIVYRKLQNIYMVTTLQRTNTITSTPPIHISVCTLEGPHTSDTSDPLSIDMQPWSSWPKRSDRLCNARSLTRPHPRAPAPPLLCRWCPSMPARYLGMGRCNRLCYMSSPISSCQLTSRSISCVAEHYQGGAYIVLLDMFASAPSPLTPCP